MVAEWVAERDGWMEEGGGGRRGERLEIGG
jgi:hypothetical protein